MWCPWFSGFWSPVSSLQTVGAPSVHNSTSQFLLVYHPYIVWYVYTYGYIYIQCIYIYALLLVLCLRRTLTDTVVLGISLRELL